MGGRRIKSTDDARAFLVELGASPRLITHGLLVSEAGDVLLAKMRSLGVSVDEGLVRAGAMLHDSGKILHPNELGGGGALHEEAGRALLVERGIDSAVARCCVTHAQWATMPCSLEDLLVALADALWKGVRRVNLEERVVAEIAAHLKRDRWSVFVELDTCFESIADGGPDRLVRSL